MAKKEVVVQASILKRIGAFVIDMLILHLFVLFPFQGTIMELFPTDATPMEALAFMQQTDIVGSIMLILILISAVCLLYFVLFERKLGQTPGKMLFKLYVVGQEKEVKTWQYLIRSLFIPIFPLFPFLAIMDFFTMLFTKDHHRLCEIMGKTKTVEMVAL